MKNLLYIFTFINVLFCIGQSKVKNAESNQNNITELDITRSQPKINLRKIPKTWKSLNSIQKEWIKVEKDKNGFLIYEPCDGNTETIKFENGNINMNQRIESQKYSYEKLTIMTGNSSFKFDAFELKSKKKFEIKAKIVDYKNGIVLWEFEGEKWFMTPKKKIKSFRILKNNCKPEKKKELEFIPIEKL